MRRPCMIVWLVVLVLTGAACSTQVTDGRPRPTASASSGAAAPSAERSGVSSARSPVASRTSAPPVVPASPSARPSVPASPPPPTPSPTPEAGTVQAVLAGMTPAQRVGQLFMVGTPASGADPQTLRQIRRYHLGSVILTGRSHDGTSGTARVAAAMQARTGAATAGVRLLVATDQEGGAVQVLQGPGLEQMPAALEQGSWSPGRLRKAAGRWARQLRRAGVNMNLAPVLDTVPSPGEAPQNAPIGAYGREYGFTPGTVARHGVAFARGMAEHGVAPTVKHFPGLGRVHGNTDYSSGVTDPTTRRDDPYLAPFRRAIGAGVPFVMMSTAYYRQLDPANPAAFSRFIIETMLRGDLGFAGVVVSDDLANAQQVARWSYGQRAVKFIAAGGDLVLAVDPAALPAMYHAVLHRARHDRGFRAKVRSAALRVLQAKQRLNLLRQPLS